MPSASGNAESSILTNADGRILGMKGVEWGGEKKNDEGHGVSVSFISVTVTRSSVRRQLQARRVTGICHRIHRRMARKR